MVETTRREVGDAACQLERLRNAELKRRGVVKRRGLLCNRFRDLGAAVPCIRAPHTGGGIDDLAAVDGEVVHVLGASEQPWRLLEGPVGGKRHPMRSEIVWNIDGGGGSALVQHGSLFERFGRLVDAQAISFAWPRER